MALSDEAIEKLAQTIALTPAQFRSIYDPLQNEFGGMPWMVLNLDPGPVPFLKALQQANGKGWLDKLATRLMESGGLPALDDETDDGDSFKVELQGLVTPETGIQSAREFNAGYMQARKRICRIQVRRPGQGIINGTGFLIAHQAVLTNWHVVQSLIESGREAPGSHEYLIIEFDHDGTAQALRVPAAEQWLIDFSPVHDSEDPHGSTIAPDSDLESFADKLDYAVIRLSKPIGRERSNYRLDPQLRACLTVPGNTVTLYQHPGGAVLGHSLGASRALWPERIETRLHHSANSIGGSSGGVLLNSDRRPIGLHQAEVTLNGTGKVNCAIPTWKIAERLPMSALIAGVEPAIETRSGLAIFGRDDLQEILLAQAMGQFRILALPGEGYPELVGELLSTLFDPADHLLASFHTRHMPASPRQFALDLISGLFPNGIADTELPDADDGKTSENAWVKDVLVPPLIDKLKQGVGTRTLWLVVSGLEENELIGRPQGYTLEHLLGRIASLPFLRVVLVGHSGVLPGIDLSHLRKRFAHPITRADYITYLQRYMVKAESVMADHELAIAVDTALGLISDDQERILSGFLPKRARDLANMPGGGQ